MVSAGPCNFTGSKLTSVCSGAPVCFPIPPAPGTPWLQGPFLKGLLTVPSEPRQEQGSLHRGTREGPRVVPARCLARRKGCASLSLGTSPRNRGFCSCSPSPQPSQLCSLLSQFHSLERRRAELGWEGRGMPEGRAGIGQGLPLLSSSSFIDLAGRLIVPCCIHN